MFFNIVSKMVRVKHPKDITIPPYLESDISAIIHDIQVSSLNRIELEHNNDDYFAMCFGDESGHVTLKLTEKVFELHKTAHPIYLEILAHEITHAKNYEIFIRKIDYVRFLKLKNHIKTKEDLFFAFGVTYLDEYLANRGGRLYSPTWTNLLGHHKDKNIYDYAKLVQRHLVYSVHNIDNAKNCFLSNQYDFESFFTLIIQVISHRDAPTTEFTNGILEKLYKAKLFKRYVELLDQEIQLIETDFPNSITESNINRFGAALFNIYTILGIHIIDINDKYNFVMHI